MNTYYASFYNDDFYGSEVSLGDILPILLICVLVAAVVAIFVVICKKAKNAPNVPLTDGEEIVLERSMFFNWFRITVTNKRVLYKGIFWRRTSLPLNRISATGTGIFGFLHIGSSAGHIMMIFFRHYREVYETIGALLNNVQ